MKLIVSLWISEISKSMRLLKNADFITIFARDTYLLCDRPSLSFHSPSPSVQSILFAATSFQMALIELS